MSSSPRTSADSCCLLTMLTTREGGAAASAPKHGEDDGGVGRLGESLDAQHDLDLDAWPLLERLADVPRAVRGLGPRRPVEGDVGAHPRRGTFAGKAVARLPCEVAEEHVCLEALLERLPLEQGVLERVAQSTDRIREDVVEHGRGRGYR